MVLGNAVCIDAILKVKSNMDSGMLNQKRAIAALNSDKSWFNSMNEIYKRRVLTERLAEKLNCKVYKEGVDCLFGLNCRKVYFF
jgi:aspartate/methionine/tyrosine aminotransferase